jgi:hypothetical protein
MIILYIILSQQLNQTEWIESQINRVICDLLMHESPTEPELEWSQESNAASALETKSLKQPGLTMVNGRRQQNIVEQPLSETQLKNPRG